MSTVLEWMFWSCLTLGFYPYVGYPMLAGLLGRLRNRRVASSKDYLPTVTVVTAARNEALCIEATVLNKLSQDYPAGRLDVVVISDASDDGTDEIVARVASGHPGRVRLFRQEPREGKTAALNRAVHQARGEIVVFSDANSIYQSGTVRKLVHNFADPEVGYVTGKMMYVNPDGSMIGDGYTAYMRFENWLRAQETRIGSIVGVDGGVDAIRRSLYRPMRSDQLPDFVLPLSVVELGARVVYEPDALLTEESLASGPEEFRMRVRVALRALWALADKRALLNPFHYGLFSFQLVSHKVLRYLSFLPLAAALVTNALLLGQGPVYAVTLCVAVLVLALAALVWRENPATSRTRLGRLAFYFVLLNLASAVATGRFLRRERVVVWQPRVG